MDGKLSLSYLKDETAFAADQWLLMADSKQKRRFGRHFDIHLDAVSRDASRSSKSGMTLGELEESELELQKKYWASQYQTFFGGGKEAPENVQAVNRQKKMETVAQYNRSLFREDCRSKVMAYLDSIANSDSALSEFLVVCRSLSIATEQNRDKFRSVYKASYPAWPLQPRVSTPSEALTAKKKTEKKKKVNLAALEPLPAANPELLQTKKILGPPANKNLLTWAGDVQGANSRYREDFKAQHQKYPTVMPHIESVSGACGRLIPEDELSAHVSRPVRATVPSMKQERFLLHPTHPSSQPSWHLLYKDGVSFTVGAKHDPGMLSNYRQEFAAKTSVVKPAQPMIDPFGSNIKIKMSDFKYLTTTYTDTIGTSAVSTFEKNAARIAGRSS